MSSRKRRGEALALAAGADPTKLASPPKARREHNEHVRGSEQGDISAAFPAIGKKRSTSQAAENSETPVQPVPSGMPPDLQRLDRAFEALLRARGFQRRRGERTTYEKLKGIVEADTKLDFTMLHLQQIKHVYPSAFNWQYISVSSPDKAGRTELHLLLTFERPAQSGREPGQTPSSAGQLNEASERAEFGRRLHDWWQQSQQQQQQQSNDDNAEQRPTKRRAVGGEGTQPAGGPAPSKPSALPHASPSASGRTQPQAAGPGGGVPLAPLPSRTDALRVVDSPRVAAAASRAASLQRMSPAHSTGSLRIPAAGTLTLTPGGRVASGSLPPIASPAPSGLAPQPSGGAPPPGPSLLLTRQNSILDSFNNRGGATKVAAAQPTPTSRAKQEAAASGAAGRVEEGAGDQGGARRVPPRRRLQLASHDEEGPAESSPPAAAAAAAQRHGAGAQQAAAPSAVTATPSKPAQVPAGAATPGSGSRHPGSLPLQQQGSGGLPPSASKPPPGPSSAAAGGSAGPVTVGQQQTRTQAASPLLSRLFSQESLTAMQRTADLVPQSPALKAAAERRHVTTLLPQVLDIVRNLFAKGPVEKPLNLVIELMRQQASLSSGMSLPEARLALQVLVQQAPEFAAIDNQGEDLILRVTRNIDINALRNKLKGLAAAAATAGPP